MESTKRCVAFPYCGECKCGQTVSTKRSPESFFDEMVKRYYSPSMLKYINMATLRDDFISVITKGIEEAKRISNSWEKYEFIDTFSIPFDFLHPWFAVSEGIRRDIKNFMYEMIKE